MSGTLSVKNRSHNKISFTWALKNYTNVMNINYTSPVFALVVEGYPVVFSVSASGQNFLTVKLRQDTQRVGRGIVTITVKLNEEIKMLTTSYEANWQENWKFGNLIPSPRTAKDLVVIGDITWLGFHDNAEISHSAPLLCAPSGSFGNETIPDFKIVIGSEEISAHKALLAFHSSYFLAMFSTPMKESHENSTTINDVEFATMRTIIQMIYTGDTKDLSDFDTALKILAVAEMYEMVAIKNICEQKLQLQITTENVMMLLDEADRHNAPV